MPEGQVRQVAIAVLVKDMKRNGLVEEAASWEKLLK